MMFGGEDRIVTLKSTSRKGKSAFSYGVEDEISKDRQTRYLFLHKPKGSNQLEIIRLEY